MMVIDQSPPPRTPPGPPVTGAATPTREAPRRASAGRRRALWAVFALEFRPYVPLAIMLLLIAFVLAGLLSWNGGKKQFWIDLRESNVLFISGLQVLLALGCAAAGVILGVCQARAWTTADLWGVFKHRPAGAGLMFAGRALAGLALYGIAAGIPMAVLLITAARGVPFEWHFVLPTVVYLLVGLVFYLAGILVIQRQASFFGTRLLPLAGASALALAVHELVYVWQALVAVAACVLLYGWAAMGAHGSNGFRLRAPRFSRLALGLVLLLGYSAILVKASWIGEDEIAPRIAGEWFDSGQAYWQSQEIRALRQEQQSWVSYILLGDGTLARRIQKWVPTPGAPDTSLGSVTFERVGPPATPYFPRIEHTTDAQGVPMDVLVERFAEFRPIGWQPRESAAPYSELTATQVEQEADGGRWWYVEPAGIFQLYDGAGRYQGSLGANGFAGPGGRAESFGGAAGDFRQLNRGIRQVFTDHGVYNVDLEARSVRPSRLLPESGRTLGFMEMTPPIAVGEDRLYIYSDPANPLPMREVPLDYTPALGDFRIAQVPDVHRWAVWHDHRIDLYDEQWQKVSQIGVPGDADRTPRVPEPPAWYLEAHAELMRKLAWQTGVLHALCNPLGLLVVDWQFEHTPYGNWASYADYHDLWYHGLFYVDESPLRNAWYFGAAAATLALSAVGMWLLARRYDVRFKSLWILGTLLFGPVMLLLLAGLQTLPRRTACPACGRPYFVHARRCPRCGAATTFAVPNGTEIFTPAGGKS